MADLVVGDNVLFLIAEHAAFLLRAGNHSLNAFLKILLADHLALFTHRAQCRLVDDVGKIRA